MKVYDVITSWKHNNEKGIERKECWDARVEWVNERVRVMIRGIGIVEWDEEKKRKCNIGWEMRHNDSVELIPPLFPFSVDSVLSPYTHVME